MKKFVQMYGKYFFVLPTILAIIEWYGIILSEKRSDWFSAIMFTVLAYYFYGMSIGKFKYSPEEEEKQFLTHKSSFKEKDFYEKIYSTAVDVCFVLMRG